jgi:hypothetical protein
MNASNIAPPRWRWINCDESEGALVFAATLSFSLLIRIEDADHAELITPAMAMEIQDQHYFDTRQFLTKSAVNGRSSPGASQTI